MLPVALFLSRLNRRDPDPPPDVLAEEYEWVFGTKSSPTSPEPEPVAKRPVKRPTPRPSLVTVEGTSVARAFEQLRNPRSGP